MEVGHNKPEARDPVDGWNLPVKAAFLVSGIVLGFAGGEKFHNWNALPLSIKDGPVAEALREGSITREQLEHGARLHGHKLSQDLLDYITQSQKERGVCDYKAFPDARLKETPDACKEKSGVETGPVKPTSSGIFSWLLARKEPRLQ